MPAELLHAVRVPLLHASETDRYDARVRLDAGAEAPERRRAVPCDQPMGQRRGVSGVGGFAGVSRWPQARIRGLGGSKGEGRGTADALHFPNLYGGHGVTERYQAAYVDNDAVTTGWSAMLTVIAHS